MCDFNIAVFCQAELLHQSLKAGGSWVEELNSDSSPEIDSIFHLIFCFKFMVWVMVRLAMLASALLN